MEGERKNVTVMFADVSGLKGEESKQAASGTAPGFPEASGAERPAASGDTGPRAVLVETDFEGMPQVNAGNSKATAPLPLDPCRDHNASLIESPPAAHGGQSVLTRTARVIRFVGLSGSENDWQRSATEDVPKLKRVSRR